MSEEAVDSRTEKRVMQLMLILKSIVDGKANAAAFFLLATGY
jgi:hypothetical protein